MKHRQSGTEGRAASPEGAKCYTIAEIEKRAKLSYGIRLFKD